MCLDLSGGVDFERSWVFYNSNIGGGGRRMECGEKISNHRGFSGYLMGQFVVYFFYPSVFELGRFKEIEWANFQNGDYETNFLVLDLLVLSVGVSFLFFYGLSYVTMVITHPLFS